MASPVDSLKTQRDTLLTIIDTQLAAWEAAGMPPTFSVDGESYSWGEWLKSRYDELDKLVSLINRLSAPWIVRSRGRG